MEQESLIDAFVSELKLVQGKAANTQRIYRDAVLTLENVLYESGKELQDATREDILAWRAAQDDRAAAGIAMDLAAIRSFYKFLKERGTIKESPVPDSMKVPVKKQDVLAHSVKLLIPLREIMRRPLLGDGGYDTVERSTLFEVLVGSGLRASAARSLCPENLNLDGDRPCIVVDAETGSCKGKRAGVVPITPLLASKLTRYLETHPKKTGERLFELAESTLRGWIREAGLEAGVQDLHPHALRKMYGSCMYFKNLDGERFNILSVQQALGHSSVETTLRYTQDYKRACNTDADWDLWASGATLQETPENTAK